MNDVKADGGRNSPVTERMRDQFAVFCDGAGESVPNQPQNPATLLKSQFNIRQSYNTFHTNGAAALASRLSVELRSPLRGNS